MASRDEIKNVILKVAGNPDTGLVVQFADAWADAIAALDEPAKPAEEKAKPPVKETRVISPAEKR